MDRRRAGRRREKEERKELKLSGSAEKHEYRAELLLSVVVVIWGANYPLLKWGIGGLDPAVFNAIRFTVASLVVVALFAARSSWQRTGSGDFIKLLGAGFVANVAYQVIFIFGLGRTTAGNAAFLLSTSPLWTLFFNALLHKERPRRSMWAGMAISLVGVTLIIFGSEKKFAFDAAALTGDLLTLAAAMMWGLNTSIQKPFLTRYSVLQVTLVMMITGGVGLTLLAVPSMAALDWGAVSWKYYAAAVASGALSIGLANAFWTNGVKRLGPGRTANFNNLVPVLAVGVSALTLKEEISVPELFGMGVTMIGVWTARRGGAGEDQSSP